MDTICLGVGYGNNANNNNTISKASGKTLALNAGFMKDFFKLPKSWALLIMG